MQAHIAASRVATEAARNQFDSSFQMLAALVDVCPEEVWHDCFYGFPYPVWYQVYHVAFFIDFWFRDAYDGSPYRSMMFDERIAPEFEHEVPPGVSISRAEMKEYLQKIQIKTSRIFDKLSDALLAKPIMPEQDQFTYQDIVLSQIRHIMYNVGYVNGILRSRDLPESDWYAYNEKEE